MGFILEITSVLFVSIHYKAQYGDMLGKSGSVDIAFMNYHFTDTLLQCQCDPEHCKTYLISSTMCEILYRKDELSDI